MKNKIFVSVFAALLALLTLLTPLTPKKDFSPNENRMLASFPALSVESVKDGSFTSGVAAWLTDHFVLRDLWVSVKALCTLAMGRRENGGVYLGKGGVLLDSFSAADASRFDENLAALRRFTGLSQTQGVSVRSLIAPTAVCIYADKLPAYAVTADTEALFTALGGVPGFVDVRNTLLAHKEEDLYYRTDHHWTCRGAYLAYADYVQSLGFSAKDESAFAPAPVTDGFFGTLYSRFGLFTGFTPDVITAPADPGGVTLTGSRGETHASVYFPEKLAEKDKYLYFLGGNDSIVQIETGADPAKKLLLIKDSYANAFLPFLLGDYGHITVLDLRYYTGSVPALLESGGYTDVLVLYNLKSFASDVNFRFLDFAD